MWIRILIFWSSLLPTILCVFAAAFLANNGAGLGAWGTFLFAGILALELPFRLYECPECALRDSEPVEL